MPSPYASKPVAHLRTVGEPRRYDECQHFTYSNRQLVQCGAPTENGCPTCKECKALEAKGTGQARRDHIATYVR